MLQINVNPKVANCGEWFSAEVIGINIGHPRDKKNKALIIKLCEVLQWYNNGHTNEDDPNTWIFQKQRDQGVLFSRETRFDLDFTVLK